MDYLLISGITVGLFALAVQVLDVLSTNRILARGGRELNPWVRALQAWFPETWGLFKYAIGVALLAAPIVYPHLVVILPVLSLSLVNGWFVRRNFAVIRRQGTTA